mgnify:CR=1 FL=1
MAPFTFARFFVGWSSVVLLCIWVRLWVLFHKKGKPLSYIRRKMITIGCFIVARIIILMMSGIWISRPKLKTDYRKYLGLDWKPSNKLPGSIVSNHSTFMDIIVHLSRQPPSHVSKAGVLKIPFVGTIASAVGCLFIERSDKD